MTKGLFLCPFLQLPGSRFLLQRNHAGEFSTCRLELRRSALLGNHVVDISLGLLDHVLVAEAAYITQSEAAADNAAE